MSLSTTSIILALVIIAHGIGHILGVMAASGIQLTSTHSSESWLFTRQLGTPASRVVRFILFTAATLLLISGGLGIFGWIMPFDRWAWLTALGSMISITGLAFFPRAFPTLFPNLLAAIAVDVAILLSVYWLHWPPVLF